MRQPKEWILILTCKDSRYMRRCSRSKSFSGTFLPISFAPPLLNCPRNWLSPVLEGDPGLGFLGSRRSGGYCWAVQNREAGRVAVHAVLIFWSDTCF